MAEHPLYRSHERAGLHGEARGRVSQVMGCDPRECRIVFLRRADGDREPSVALRRQLDVFGPIAEQQLIAGLSFSELREWQCEELG